MRESLVALTLAAFVGCSFGQAPPPAAQPPAEALTASGVRARTEREWSVKAAKMRQHLLPLMRRHGVDLWVVMSRENVPDPVIELFGGLGVTGWYGHRNAYLFADRGAAGLETTVIGTHLSQHLKAFYGTIQPYGQEGLKPHLEKYLQTRSPKRIAINQSRTISMADGLTAELKAYLLDALGPAMAGRARLLQRRHQPRQDDLDGRALLDHSRAQASKLRVQFSGESRFAALP